MGTLSNLTIKRKNAVTKGHHGYLKFRKRQLFLRTMILFLGAAGLVVIGIVVTKTNKNWMSLIAIFTAVPMCMQLVSYIALGKFFSRPEEEYRELRALTGNGLLDTELVVGRRDGKSLPVDYVYVHEDGIFVYTSEKNCDVKATTEYLHTFLRLSQVDDNIYLFTDLRNYKARLKSLSPSDRESCSETLLEREGVFRAISM